MTPPTVDEIRVALAEAQGTALERLIRRYARDERSGVRTAAASARRRLLAERAEDDRLSRLYAMEAELHEQGHAVIAGVDEVGRGALAGPLTAAAVVLPLSPRIEGLDDSKRLTPERREVVAAQVKQVALAWSITHVPPADIDGLGMTAALRRAVLGALHGLDLTADRVVLDGLPLGVSSVETAVVKGDSRVAAIAAASVIAKVARDELMRSLAPEHPAYGFDINKGYGTTEHIAAISRLGPCPHHRRSFAPCAENLTLFDA